MQAAVEINDIIQQPLSNPFEKPVAYLVQPGDTLSQIIYKYYDVPYQDPLYKIAEASVVFFNKSITDPNQIRAGEVITLMPLSSLTNVGQCEIPSDFYKEKRDFSTTRHTLEPSDNSYLNRYQHTIDTLSPDEREAFWALAWLQENYDFMAIPAGAGFNAWGGLVSQSHNTFISDAKMLWEQYQRGQLTKGQYDYQRQLALKKYSKKLGPFEKVLLKGNTAQQAIRINRTKALPATAKIDHHLQRLGNMAKYAKHGGVVLTAAGVGMGCYNIGQAQTREEKNEIFVETVASTIVGTSSSYALAVILATTPVGWAAAIALGVGATALSWASGKGFSSVYNRYGKNFDLVKITNVDQLCK